MQRLAREPRGVAALYGGAENGPAPVPLVSRDGAGYERNRERPVLCADVEGRDSARLLNQAVHFPIFLNEPLTVECVLDFVIRADEVSPRSKNLRHGPLIVPLDRGKEGAAGILGRREGCLAQWPSQTKLHRTGQQQCEYRECGACGSPAARTCLELTLHCAHHFSLRRSICPKYWPRVHLWPPPPWKPPPP